MEQLTINEALEKGYTHYIFQKDGFSFIKSISEMDPTDLERDDIVIVDPEPYHSVGMSAGDMKDFIVEQIACQSDDETGDDTDTVFDALVKHLDAKDFELICDKIQSVLNGINYYKPTEIKLIP